MQTSAIPNLSNSTLLELPSGVKIPNYNRSNLTGELFTLVWAISTAPTSLGICIA